MLITSEDVDEHLFELGSGDLQNNLGIISRANELEIDMNGEAIEIKQSINLLVTQSTGAMVWNTSPRFAKWALTPSSPVHSLIVNRNIIELGSGTGVLARLLGAASKQYYATDQKPLLKLAKQNVEGMPNVHLMEFDWEKHEFNLDLPAETTTILACDTIYNEYLLTPFIAGLQSVLRSIGDVPIIIAVQIRDLDVLGAALNAFLQYFTVEYIEDVSPELQQGFAIYILNRII